jgi:phosphoheptose isomerase
MDPIVTLSNILDSHIDVVEATFGTVAEAVSEAGEAMVHALGGGQDNKILCAGSGPQSAIAQLFTSHLVNQLSFERPGLPAIALSSDNCLLNTLCENNQYADSLARQVSTLGDQGDILLLLAGTSTRSLTRAISAAHDREMTVILLHGADQSDAAALLNSHDIEIALPVTEGARLLETHVLLVNSLCELIDMYLFGGGHS